MPMKRLVKCQKVRKAAELSLFVNFRDKSPLLPLLSVLVTFNGGELVPGPGLQPAERRNPGYSGLREEPELSQSVILSVITRGWSANSQKCVKVSNSRRAREEHVDSSTRGLLPTESTSRLIIGGLSLPLSDRCPIPSFCACGFPR